MTDVSYYKGQLADVKKKLEQEEHKAACEEVAKELHILYVAMCDAGFAEAQAWEITRLLLVKAINDTL